MKQRSIWAGGLALIGLIAALFFSQLHGFSAGATTRGNLSLAVASDVSPLVAQAEAPAVVQINGAYEDPEGRFQIGILDGFSVNSVAGSPLFEAGDGSLAYSVVIVSAGGEGSLEAPLTNAALAQAVKSTFARGEGFQTTGFEVIDGGGVQIAWVGRLSNGGITQPVQGKVVARQVDADIYLLAVSATEAGAAQVDSALVALAESLQVL